MQQTDPKYPQSAKRWNREIRKIDKDRRVIGKVFGHPKWKDGKLVSTSAIEGVAPGALASRRVNSLH